MTQPRTIKIGKYTLPMSPESFGSEGHGDYCVRPEAILFDFSYRQLWFRCQCDAGNSNTAQINLYGCLGAIPFTAESPYARTNAIAIANAASRHLHGAITIADGYIVFNQKNAVESPVTSVILVSAIVTALTKLNPYITLLGDIVRPPSRKNLPAAHTKV